MVGGDKGEGEVRLTQGEPLARMLFLCSLRYAICVTVIVKSNIDDLVGSH
jgi:hypothetical protein